MSRPGIVLAVSGLHFAIRRLEDVENKHKEKSNMTTEANIVRAGCETLFWLFALNEDFKKLIKTKEGMEIHVWWEKKGVAGQQMNGLRLARNRITHYYKYYWQMWDLATLTWAKIDPPTPSELSSKTGKYIPGQYKDYQDTLEGRCIVTTLKVIAQVILDVAVMYDLTNW